MNLFLEIVLFSLTGIFPVINIFTGFFVYKFALKYNPEKCRLIVFSGIILMVIIGGLNLVTVLSAFFSFSAFFVIYKKNMDFEKKILKPVFIITALIMIFFYKPVFDVGNNLENRLLKIMKDDKIGYYSSLKQLEFKEPGFNVDSYIEQSVKSLTDIMPAVTVVYIFFGVMIPAIHFFYNFILGKQIKFAEIENIKNYFLNDKLVFVFIGLLGFIIAVKTGMIQNEIFIKVINNFMTIIVSLYFVQGIMAIMYVVKKINLMFPLFVILVTPFFFFVVMIGVFDVWYDFRKIRTSNMSLNV